MGKLLLRWIVAIIALFAAVYFIPGIHVEGTNAWIAVAILAVILGLVNALIRPLLKLLSCGLIVLTMGLFMLVINALMLWLSSYIAVNWFSVGFYVDGFWAALFGSIVVSIVSFLLSLVIGGD